MTLSGPSPGPTPADLVPNDNDGEELIDTMIGGRYRATRIIGRGGMGVVLEGVHEALGQPYAIKVLGRAYAQNETVVRRFLREARTVAKIGHPHIVGVHDLGRLEDGRPYLVMELVNGRTFKDMVLQDGVFTPERVAQLFEGVADALEVVHARGIVHRDIKLENLMLAIRPEGPPIVKLLDFGVASAASNDRGDNRITQHGWLVGTPLYLPPEAGLGTRADARWDVYALGVVAFTMLTARWPFDGEGPMVVLTKKMTESPPPLSGDGKVFSAAVEAVVARALAQRAEDRYASARELVDALTAATRQEQVETADIPSPVAIDTPAATPRKTILPERPWPWAAAAWAGATLVVAAVAWLLTGGHGLVSRSPIIELAGEPQRPGRADPMPAVSDPPPRPLPAATAAPPAAASPSPVPEGASPVPEAASPSPASLSAPKATPTRLASAVPPAATPSARPTPPKATPTRAPLTSAEPFPAAPGRDPARAESLTRDGMSAMVEGRLARAIELFRDATIADDRHVPAWRALATANDRMNLSGEARLAYRRYLALAGAGEDPAVVAHARHRLEVLNGTAAAPEP